VVCKRPEGLPAFTFVEEYLGELHSPWRWFEFQVGKPVGVSRLARQEGPVGWSVQQLHCV
jgi:hypothetical protein